MDTQYFITSTCLSSIIHRLSLKTSTDFEGLLIGVVTKEQMAVIQDEGGVHQVKTSILIHRMVLVVGKVLRLNAGYVTEVLERMPRTMVRTRQTLLGWVVGRKDCPPLPSYGDKATARVLRDLQTQNHPNVSQEHVILGCFSMRTKSSATSSSEPPGEFLAMDYKFHVIQPPSTLVPIPVTVPNLHETEAAYNAIKFVYQLPENPEIDQSRSLEAVKITTDISWREGQNIVEQLRQWTPKERARNVELESVSKRNLELKVQLFNKNRKNSVS